MGHQLQEARPTFHYLSQLSRRCSVKGVETKMRFQCPYCNKQCEDNTERTFHMILHASETRKK